MKKPVKLILVMIGSLLSGACDYDKSSEVIPIVKDNVSFSLDIQPILTAQCATCHSLGKTEPDLRKGYAYESLKGLEEGSIVPGDAEGSELIEMLEGGGDNPMPPRNAMTPTKVALIKKWIDEGALDN
jgi:hypothetical protein